MQRAWASYSSLQGGHYDYDGDDAAKQARVNGLKGWYHYAVEEAMEAEAALTLFKPIIATITKAKTTCPSASPSRSQRFSLATAAFAVRGCWQFRGSGP